MKEALYFLRKDRFTSFPFPFSQEFSEKSVKPYWDKEKQMHYCLLDGKRLYFPRKMKPQQIRRQFCNLLIEQHPKSAHRYITEKFAVQDGNIVIDAGAAEGNFSLSVIEKASKLVLIEVNPDWLEALEATFEPWKDKTIIINKFISDHTSDTTITMDKIVEELHGADFIKIDVEGEESRVLAGSKQTMSLLQPPKIALCTYHKEGDPENLFASLQRNGYHVEFSDGYLIYVSRKGLEFPYLRKGILRACKSGDHSISQK
ncbi:MAG TPA: FkbM family methyltransferase [Bacteroidales bacterium]|nr:FkbM family methyltransferase [Bacteroidales bacterium]